MRLDEIQLPALVLQQLYTRSLVQPGGEAAILKKSLSKPLSTLGNNIQHILIIVESTEALYLPDDELNFLLGILSACKLTMADVAILNIANNPNVNYTSLKAELSPGKLFLFGVSPQDIGLPLDFPKYQVQRFNNQIYLAAPALAVFRDDKEEKTKLWNSLKVIFGINS
jgi:hypothetical protein